MSKKSIASGKMYLFSENGNKNLIITAHGGKTDKNFNIPKNNTLWFCGRHGKSTITDADDIVKALKVGGDVRLLQKLKDRGLHAYFTPTGKILDYELSKFSGTHGGGDYENYDTYEHFSSQGFDIASPRNRWYSKGLSLSSVLSNTEIKKNNYKNIYLSFCRS